MSNHIAAHGTTVTSVILPSIMWFPLLYTKTLENGCALLKNPSLLSHCFPMYHGLWHWSIPSKNSNHTIARITLSSLSLLSLLQCWLCDIPQCHISLYHAPTSLPNIMHTLVATCKISGRLEYHGKYSHNRNIYIHVRQQWKFN